MAVWDQRRRWNRRLRAATARALVVKLFILMNSPDRCCNKVSNTWIKRFSALSTPHWDDALTPCEGRNSHQYGGDHCVDAERSALASPHHPNYAFDARSSEAGCRAAYQTIPAGSGVDCDHPRVFPSALRARINSGYGATSCPRQSTPDSAFAIGGNGSGDRPQDRLPRCIEPVLARPLRMASTAACSPPQPAYDFTRRRHRPPD